MCVSIFIRNLLRNSKFVNKIIEIKDNLDKWKIIINAEWLDNIVWEPDIEVLSQSSGATVKNVSKRFHFLMKIWIAFGPSSSNKTNFRKKIFCKCASCIRWRLDPSAAEWQWHLEASKTLWFGGQSHSVLQPKNAKVHYREWAKVSRLFQVYVLSLMGWKHFCTSQWKFHLKYC